MPHGSQVLPELVFLWISTLRIMCTDSNFVSVTAVELLFIDAMKYIGVVKTATHKV